MQILIALTLFFISIYILSISVSFIKETKISTFIIVIIILLIGFGWIVWGIAGYESKNDKSKVCQLQNYKMYRIQNNIILEFKDMSKIKIELNDSIKNIDSSEMKFVMLYHYNLYNYLVDSTLTITKK